MAKNIDMEYYAMLQEAAGIAGETLAGEFNTAHDVFEHLKTRFDLPLGEDHLRVAINDEFSPWETVLNDGDKLVFIPPVSGGSGVGGFSLADTPINAAEQTKRFRIDRAGAYVTFEGWVRDHNDGKSVDHLDYQAYAAMAEREGNGIVADALAKFDIIDATCLHRVGSLSIGDTAVYIGVNAEHRGDAFTACEFIIDEVKRRVPIWKKEYYTNGTAEWVACHCVEHVH